MEAVIKNYIDKGISYILDGRYWDFMNEIALDTHIGKKITEKNKTKILASVERYIISYVIRKGMTNKMSQTLMKMNEGDESIKNAVSSTFLDIISIPMYTPLYMKKIEKVDSCNILYKISFYVIKRMINEHYFNGGLNIKEISKSVISSCNLIDDIYINIPKAIKELKVLKHQMLSLKKSYKKGNRDAWFINTMYNMYLDIDTVGMILATESLMDPKNIYKN